MPCSRFARLLFALVLAAFTLAAPAQTAPTSGQPVPSLSQLDTIMQQYMTQYNSPGANLSVSVDGRLVFARGYGYANTTTGEFVQPDSRMRLASNSKPFTAAAIYKLIEQGKLSLSTKPFATIFTDLTPPPGTTVDPRIYNITIQNLLEHKAGYDDGAGYPFDPVNDYPTNRAAANDYGLTGQACTPRALISYELGVALQHDPGTTYAYSNLGYLTLGYVIERVTNTPYATWLEQNIFPLANMQQTLPAGNLASQKLPYEVAYYGYPGEPTGPSMVPPIGTQVPYEYGGYDLVLELANGGWTSTPMDLLRFNDSLNGQFSTNILASPPSGYTGEIPPYGQGWEYIFYGSLPGTNSLVHLFTSSAVVGRVTYSAIFNTRDGNNIEEPESDADNAIAAFVKTVKAWPTGDMFPTYATSGTACSFSLASATATAPMAGNTGTDVLTDANYCAWSATSNATWLHVTSAAINNTTGTVAYTADANTGASRTGVITAGGQTLTVTQNGVATPTTLMLSGTRVYNGTNTVLTLTAVLSPSSNSSATTDGESVSFDISGANSPSTPLGTAKLSGGKATLTTTVAGQTTNFFDAAYAGDSTFAASNDEELIASTSTTATVSPATLTFPSTPTGIVSAAQTSTFTNTGTTALSINLILVSGPFKQTNTCGGSVAAGATCTFTVTYNPTAAGASTGSIDVSDQAGDQIISLSGTATAAAPVVTLSAASLTFPSTTVNTSAPVQPVTLTNTGNAPLTITNIAAVSGNNQFTQTNNCTAAAIAVNASCTVNVTFSPTSTGTLTANVLITDNASPTTQSIALTGTAVAGPTPAVTLAPASLTFPATQVASTSPAQTAMLTNSGTAALSITGITASAGFAQTNTCPASLAANATCTITVTTTPAAVGAYTGSITLADNAANSPQTIALTGTGAAFSAPTITATGTATSLNYGQAVTINASATGVQAAGGYTWSLLDGATVVTSGVAYTAAFTYTIPTPTAGTHSYTAVLTSTTPATYPNGTSNVVTVTVAKASTASSFPAPAAITYGTPLGNAQLAATSATPGTFTYTPPAGTVLTAGTQALSATLNPTDATDYATSTASTSILVNKATLTAAAANSTRPYGAANPTFAGTLTGVVNADAITASFTSTATATTAAGATAPITPMLADPGNRLGNYNTTLTPAVLTITQAGTTATLTGPANTPAGSTVTLTATIASNTTGTPSGTVTFTAGGVTLGTPMLAGGTATVSYTPPTGSSTVSVTYSGDNNFTGSTGSLVVTTGTPDYSITAAPPTATITAGQSATFTLTATPVNGFSQSVFYTCGSLPAHTTCLFEPFYVTPGSSAQSSQLIISTSVASASLTKPGFGFGGGLAGTALAFLLGLPLLRRRNPVLRRSLLSLLLLLGLGGMLAVSGCGANTFGSNPTATTTPAGTYTVNVNANAYGGATHTTALTITVK